jgi:hypothetical protein
MSDAAGELADRIHLLALPQRLLGVAQGGFPLPRLGNVAPHAM